MTNLASREKAIVNKEKYICREKSIHKTEFISKNSNIFQKQNVIYGCFEQKDNKAVVENAKNMLMAEVKAGISLGLKFFTSALFGIILAQVIFDWQDIKAESLPSFVFVLMWIACAGSLFSITGLLRNIIYIAFRK